MALLEFLVRHVQRFVPTLFLRLCVRYYFKLYFGWRLRRGNVVVSWPTLVTRHPKYLKFVDYRCDRSTWIVAVGNPCRSPRTLTRGAIQYRYQTCSATHFGLILWIDHPVLD